MPLSIENSKAVSSGLDHATPSPDGVIQDAGTNVPAPPPKHVRPKPWVGFLELFTVALISTLLGAIGARVAQVGKVGVNLKIAAQAPVVSQDLGSRVVGVAYFINGSARIDPESAASIERWARALSSCQNGQFAVVGSTSSVPFRPGSLGTNPQLAKARAQAVVEILKRSGITSVKSMDADEKDLVRERLLNDNPTGRGNAALEAVARRADILLVDLGVCKVPLSSQ